MTQADVDSGRLAVIVGVAPVRLAEFVIIRIGIAAANFPEHEARALHSSDALGTCATP